VANQRWCLVPLSRSAKTFWTSSFISDPRSSLLGLNIHDISETKSGMSPVR
jgi:hypothetical protein